MKKTILITGSTDGIGLEAAKLLAADGHQILLHGRNQTKLDTAKNEISNDAQTYLADLSSIKEVEALAKAVRENHDKIDVLINNAGVLKTNSPIGENGLDVRFMVNTLAPYLLTRQLLPLMDNNCRIINLSSAAQASVNLDAMAGNIKLPDMEAYSQSKLAITMWSKELADELQNGPIVVAVNPGSLLATKMVKEGFGMAGNDINIGAEILYRSALSDEFGNASGQYFDNDARRFSNPHPDALDKNKRLQVTRAIENLLEELTG